MMQNVKFELALISCILRNRMEQVLAPCAKKLLQGDSKQP